MKSQLKPITLEHPESTFPNHFVASTRAFSEHLQPIVSRLQSHGKIPSCAIAMDIDRSDFEQVIQLHRLLFSDTSDSDVLVRLKNEAPDLNYSLTFSKVIKTQSDVIGTGIVLTELHEDAAFLFAVIVPPDKRGTWVNAYLKYALFNGLLKAGIDHVVFRADSTSVDSVKHAHKVDAKPLD